MAIYAPKALTPDEFERATHTELVQFAAALDRMLAQCCDRDLAAKLAPIRGHVSAATDALAERCQMVRPTPAQLAWYRRFPGTSLDGWYPHEPHRYPTRGARPALKENGA